MSSMSHIDDTNTNKYFENKRYQRKLNALLNYINVEISRTEVEWLHLKNLVHKDIVCKKEETAENKISVPGPSKNEVELNLDPNIIKNDSDEEFDSD